MKAPEPGIQLIKKQLPLTETWQRIRMHRSFGAKNAPQDDRNRKLRACENSRFGLFGLSILQSTNPVYTNFWKCSILLKRRLPIRLQRKFASLFGRGPRRSGSRQPQPMPEEQIRRSIP